MKAFVSFLILLAACGAEDPLPMTLTVHAQTAMQSYDIWVLEKTHCATIGDAPIAGLDGLDVIAYQNGAAPNASFVLTRGQSYTIVIDGFSATNADGAPAVRGCSDVAVAKNASSVPVNINLGTVP
jgi:hypothetical protein